MANRSARHLPSVGASLILRLSTSLSWGVQGPWEIARATFVFLKKLPGHLGVHPMIFGVDEQCDIRI